VEAAEMLLRGASAADPASGLAPLSLPATYCLRHSIELLLKFLALALNKPLKYSHDAKSLLSAIKEPLQAIDRAELERVASLVECKPELIGSFLETSSEKIEKLANKYHEYLFLDAGRVQDPKNEIFRYPTTLSSGGNLDIDRFTESFSIDETLSEAEDLRMFLFSLLVLFGKTSSGKTLTESLE